MNTSPPIAEFGCIDCRLPSAYDDVLFYFFVLSPFVLTVGVSFFFVRRAQAPIGFLRLAGISALGGLPAATGLALTFESQFEGIVATAIFAVFLWAVTFGPLCVFFTQWIYLEVRRILDTNKE